MTIKKKLLIAGLALGALAVAQNPVARGVNFAAIFTGMTANRTYTMPDANATVLTTNAAVTATQGGTGQATWTTGDLLYASATNTLAKLGIGTTGQVLTVTGGVPVWGAAAGGFDPLAQSPRVEYDDFITFSGTKFGYGTQNLGCTVTTAPEAGHIGVWKLAVAATTNNACVYALATGVSSNIINQVSSLSGNTNFAMSCWIKTDDTSIANTGNWCGIGNTGLIGADGFGIRYNNGADTNWMCYNENGGTTTTSTGVAVATNTWYYLRVAVTGTNQITCTVNGANAAVVNATFSSAGAAPGFRLVTNSASAHNMLMDFWAMKW